MKMDASNNDVPSPFEVRGFPTLYWVPKNDKTKPVKYEVCHLCFIINRKCYVLNVCGILIFSITQQGGRDVEDFIKYAAKQATSELNGFDRKGKAKKEEL